MRSPAVRCSAHVLSALRMPEARRYAVVVGPEHDDVAAEARANFADAQVFVQNERRGTAHAVSGGQGRDRTGRRRHRW